MVPEKLRAADIARRLKRSLNSTKKKASMLGVPLGRAARWTKADLRKLRTLAKNKRSVAKIAKQLKRTIAAIEKMASNHRISLDIRD
jgi:predicted RNase H-like nuclease (RuvC/YqgF family)